MKITKAKDCKCIKCNEQAKMFWPVIDPDIKAEPYCTKCAKEEQAKVMNALKDLDNE
ncbi:MAG: hypothetical protein GY775_16645 [Candidatus Scalindua sp.]|nr:hypothetical protein [Candidatus Scalindua sp.]